MGHRAGQPESRPRPGGSRAARGPAPAPLPRSPCSMNPRPRPVRRAASGLWTSATCRAHPREGLAKCSTPGRRIPRIQSRNQQKVALRSGRAQDPPGLAAGGLGRRRLAWSLGRDRPRRVSGREVLQPGLDVDARTARDGKCLIKPQPEQSDRLLAAPPRARAARSRPRVRRARAHPRGTNFYPRGLLTAVERIDRVPQRIPDRPCPDPLCPGGPQAGAEGAPGGRGMRLPRHGLGGV